MELKAATSHRIEIHQSDIAEWFSARYNDIDPTTIKLSNGLDKVVYLSIPISLEYMDTFLRAVIDDLPPFNEYKWEVLPYSADVVGIITWVD